MKFISLLRGINVSGQKSIKMVDLKALYEGLGFENVLTYIQSGNVIFDSSLKKNQEVVTLIEKAISKKYGFTVPVEIRTAQELRSIVDGCPFGEVDVEKEGTKVLVSFLSGAPAKDKLLQLQQQASSSEELVQKAKEIYLYCPNGYGKSKLTNNMLERKLSLRATTRNWKSILKLAELANA